MLRWVDKSGLQHPVTGRSKCYGLYVTCPCAPDANIKVFDCMQNLASHGSEPLHIVLSAVLDM